MTVATVPHISAGSTEYVRVPVRARDNGAVVDPTIYTVSAAMVNADYPDGVRAPATASYFAQTWDTDAGPTYFVEVLVGASGALDPTGPSSSEDSVTYDLWIRIIAGSEDLRRKVGQIVITP